MTENVPRITVAEARARLVPQYCWFSFLPDVIDKAESDLRQHAWVDQVAITLDGKTVALIVRDGEADLNEGSQP